MGDPPTGVSEGYVLSMGVELPHRLRVSFHEFTQRQVILLNYLVKIIYRRYLEFTSIAVTSSLPVATTHLLPVGTASKRRVLFTQVPRR